MVSGRPLNSTTASAGGAVVTNDAAVAQQVRVLRQHGMSVPDTVRHGSSTVIFENHPVLGFNYRMSNVLAGIGRGQLRVLDQRVAQRRRSGRPRDDLGPAVVAHLQHRGRGAQVEQVQLAVVDEWHPVLLVALRLGPGQQAQRGASAWLHVGVAAHLHGQAVGAAPDGRADPCEARIPADLVLPRALLLRHEDCG